jgi:hypothetical protein
MGWKLAAQLPGAHLVVIPRAKHSAHQERAHESARLVLDFVGDAVTRHDP